MLVGPLNEFDMLLKTLNIFHNFRWFFPFIGHMGICTSTGIIRDFAGPYYVGQNQMAFGKPTRYLRLDPEEATGRILQTTDVTELLF